MDAESRASKSSTPTAEARELCVSILQVLIEENEDGGCEGRRCMRSLIHIESSSEAFTHSLAVTASFNKGARGCSATFSGVSGKRRCEPRNVASQEAPILLLMTEMQPCSS
jgi:hypothetical protein